MKADGRVLAVLLALVLTMLAGTPAVFAVEEQPALGQSDEPDDPIAVATPARIPEGTTFAPDMADELRRLLEEDAGGEITLTGDVVWNESASITVTRPVTVKMDAYSIRVPARFELRISGPVRFEGTGNPSPLLRVEGHLYTGPGVEIAAEGDGAVAVEITRSEAEGSEDAMDGSWESEFVSVSARGNGAAAVVSNGEVSISFIRVEARGENAAGIRAEDFVRLTACEVLADGEAVFSETGDIMLDVCRVSPLPAGARVINRRAEPGNRILQNGISVAATDAPTVEAMEEYWEFNGISFNLIDVNGIESVLGFWVDARWENLPGDWSFPRTQTITCVPVGIPDWLPLEGIGAFDLPFHIVGKNQPHISDASRFGPDFVMLRFFSEITYAEALTLWVSGDGGASWRDITEIEGSFVNPSAAGIEVLKPNWDYQFLLEVTGGPMAGVSNTLIFPYYDTDPDREGGGDRDDDNYEDGQNALPDVGGIIPPPDDSEGDDGGTEPPPSPPGSQGGGDGSSGPPDDGEGDDGGDQGGDTGTEPPPLPPDSQGGGNRSSGPTGGRSGSTGGTDRGGSNRDATAETAKVTETTAEPTFSKAPDPALSEQKAALSLTGPGLSAQLRAYPQGLTVTERGIKAIFPARLLEGIELADGEEFSVLLERTAADRFLIRLLAGSREITDFGGETFFIHMVYDAAEGALSNIRCEDASGVATPAGRYEDGRFVFELSATGEYRVFDDFPAVVKTEMTAPAQEGAESSANPSTEEKPGFPFVPAIACGLVPPAAGAAVLCRRRRGRRGT